MGLKEKLACIARGFDADKYFGLRKKCLRTRSKLLKAYYRWRIIRIEGATAYIGMPRNDDGRDIFENTPTLIHGISGIFICASAKIGKNAKIMQNVTIGKSNGLSPVIGDNVFIGANACIIGGVRIGNNVRIGAGAVVVKDVPDNTTVVSQPCRYIRKESDYRYIVDTEKD